MNVKSVQNNTNGKDYNGNELTKFWLYIESFYVYVLCGDVANDKSSRGKERMC